MRSREALGLVLIFAARASWVSAEEIVQLETLSIPEPWVEEIKKQGLPLQLSLKEAMRLALINNLEIQIENYNEDLSRELVHRAAGFYDPVLAFRVGWNSYEWPNTSFLDAGFTVPTTIEKRWDFTTSFHQEIKGGGNFRTSFSNFRGTTNSSWVFINPRYNSYLDFRFIQPLWRGFRETQTAKEIKIYKLDTQISDSRFKQKVAGIIEQVHNRYWELVYAIENFETRRLSLELAITQYNDNKKRLEVGVIPPIDIISARTEVAARERSLIQSRVQILRAQNLFKGDLAPDPEDELWNATIIPTDRLNHQDIEITLKEAAQTAMERRPEIEEIHLELEKTGVDRSFVKKEGKPRVNLEFGLTSRGTAGNVLVDNPEQPNATDPTHPLFGDFATAWNQMIRFSWPDYRAAVSVEIPLKNRHHHAELARIAIQRHQWRDRLRSMRQEILVEVRNAYQTVGTQKQSLETAQLARELSERQLAGENKRYQAGLSTNFNVLRYQRDLADARVEELRAMIDYQLAITALQKAMFTILEEGDFVIAKRDG